MEMFERDVQPSLDNYLAGRSTETRLPREIPPVAAATLTDYRPLVEFAREWKWPVVASDVPRRLASLVSRRGLKTVLDSLSPADRAFAARDLECPHDDYFAQFAKTMADDAVALRATRRRRPPPTKAAMIERIYQAQCIKDETMGESIANAFVAAPAARLVVHVNGAFHSDYGLGTAERVKRRLPGKRVVVVSFVPVQRPRRVLTEGRSRTLADFIVYTLAPAPPHATGAAPARLPSR